MKKSSEDMLVCTKCIADPRFAQWIRQTGRRGQCDFDSGHGNRGRAVPVGAFAVHVDEFFRERYELGEEEGYFDGNSDRLSYRQRGSTLLEILSDDLRADSDVVVQAIIDNLPDVSHRDIAQGADPFYDDLACYESIEDVHARERADQEEYWYENRFAFQWDDFCRTVQYERRFFNIKQLLDNLFGKPTDYEGEQINPLYLLKAGQSIFRTRLLDDSFTEEVLHRNPARELSAPPPERTRAGRMNVEYIPAFYGAFSDYTAVAELRPGIGENVAIGEFALQRDVKVFDFTVFSSAKKDGSSVVYEHTRYEFIDQMEAEISRHVLPYEKQRQYISTQIVAEYLREYFKCEGVIYRSSVVKNDAAESRNIVLLPQRHSFVGHDIAVLNYKSHRIEQIDDVTYQFADVRF